LLVSETVTTSISSAGSISMRGRHSSGRPNQMKATTIRCSSAESIAGTRIAGS
jgi:hypothetical protein